MNRTEKLKRFEKALDLFLDRVRKDPNLLAAVLVGSLTEETIWQKDAICLWLIEKDGVTKRLRADGEDPRIFRSLVEEGVNLHVELIPRTRFKRIERVGPTIDNPRCFALCVAAQNRWHALQLERGNRRGAAAWGHKGAFIGSVITIDTGAFSHLLLHPTAQNHNIGGSGDLLS